MMVSRGASIVGFQWCPVVFQFSVAFHFSVVVQFSSFPVSSFSVVVF